MKKNPSCELIILHKLYYDYSNWVSAWQLSDSFDVERGSFCDALRLLVLLAAVRAAAAVTLAVSGGRDGRHLTTNKEQEQVKGEMCAEWWKSDLCHAREKESECAFGSL